MKLVGKEARFGLLLYAGEQPLPFGEGVAAVPLGGFLGGPGGA